MTIPNLNVNEFLNSVPHDYLGLLHGNTPKKVVDFLEFDRFDVAKAMGLKDKSQVRFDIAPRSPSVSSALLDHEVEKRGRRTSVDRQAIIDLELTDRVGGALSPLRHALCLCGCAADPYRA